MVSGWRGYSALSQDGSKVRELDSHLLHGVEKEASSVHCFVKTLSS